jgi:hypothetical protein
MEIKLSLCGEAGGGKQDRLSSQVRGKSRRAGQMSASMTDYRKMAQAMDQRACELMKEGVTGPELMYRMVGHLPELNQIWLGTTDEQLAELCGEYPGFYQYASLMEEGAEAERAKPQRKYDGLEPLNDELKLMLEQFLTEAAKLEQGYHTVINAGSQPGSRALMEDLVKRHRRWLSKRESFILEAKEADVSDKTWQLLEPLMNDVVERIAKAKRKAVAR